MPELPEVETIVRALRDGGRGAPPVVGRQVAAEYLLWRRTLVTPAPDVFSSQLIGQTIQRVDRRGKLIILSLTREFLLIHLRMSGDIRVAPWQEGEAGTPQFHSHDRLALRFMDGLGLYFNDARKFGRTWLVSSPEEVVSGLGPEPLSPDFTPGIFFERLKRVNRRIKPLLLDQGFLAGMGNIYTDEALHLAKIHPNRLSSSLSREEITALWSSIRAVLEKGIESHGASIDWVYRGGDFQNNFRVYQRTGLPCPVCGTPIQRIVVGQRGTHLCPVCQMNG